jgi:hypothetical protein
MMISQQKTIRSLRKQVEMLKAINAEQKDRLRDLAGLDAPAAFTPGVESWIRNDGESPVKAE